MLIVGHIFFQLLPILQPAAFHRYPPHIQRLAQRSSVVRLKRIESGVPYGRMQVAANHLHGFPPKRMHRPVCIWLHAAYDPSQNGSHLGHNWVKNNILWSCSLSTACSNKGFCIVVFVSFFFLTPDLVQVPYGDPIWGFARVKMYRFGSQWPKQVMLDPSGCTDRHCQAISKLYWPPAVRQSKENGRKQVKNGSRMRFSRNDPRPGDVCKQNTVFVRS